jgi:hypothetical protein
MAMGRHATIREMGHVTCMGDMRKRDYILDENLWMNSKSS